MSSTADLAGPAREGAVTSGTGDRLDDVWTLFAITWAAAVLFHLAGNPTLAPQWGRAFLGVAAVALLVRPRLAWLAALLSVAVLTNVWLEAPLLANHWLLHGFVAVVVLLAVVAARGRPAPAMARIGGPSRLTLLAFYGFAAFAKLNTDFFDPLVSCANFYLRESADSWGALSMVDGWPSWGERAVTVAVAGVELAVPVLLIIRRTRNIGVLVALGFHFLLAVDRTHQFFDFSSVLLVLFLLFLDPATVGGWFDEARAVRARLVARWSSGPELLRLFVGGTALAVVVLAAGPREWRALPRLRELGVWVWLVYGLAVFVAVVWSLRKEPGTTRPLVGPSVPPWLLLVPLLAVANGLTPYLELKTANGWNMYSNLSVIDGKSNHLIVRAGLPLTDAHQRLVEIVESSESALDFYIDGDWLVPERQLLDYLTDRSDATIEGRVDGEAVSYEGGGGARPEWQQNFQVFRAVDASGPVNCQPSFGPAR